jgi:hypothetical protein
MVPTSLLRKHGTLILEGLEVDCWAFACMSDQVLDFIPDTLKPCNKRVQTFGGHFVSNIQIGIIQWQVQSDNGTIHTFKIPDSYYVPEGGAQLLSPQHWSKTRLKKDKVRGLLAQSVVTGCGAQLEWNQRKDDIELRHDHRSNVFDLVLALLDSQPCKTVTTRFVTQIPYNS